MSSRASRVIAECLLRQVRGYRAESLIGDLMEEYAQGRSALWYWRQVLYAVITSYLRLLRIHGISFASAVALGAGGVQGCVALVQWMSEVAWHRELAMSGTALTAGDLRTAELTLFWVAWTPLTAVIYGFLGRIIAAVYRPHPQWVVGIFMGLILLSRLPWTLRLFLVDFGDTWLVPYPVQDLIATLICASAAWLGCLWHLRVERRSRMPKRILP